MLKSANLLHKCGLGDSDMNSTVYYCGYISFEIYVYLKFIHYFFVTQYHFIPDLDSRGTAKLMHGETHKNPKAYMLEDTRILAWDTEQERRSRRYPLSLFLWLKRFIINSGVDYMYVYSIIVSILLTINQWSTDKQFFQSWCKRDKKILM